MLRCLRPEFKLPDEAAMRTHILHVRACLNMLGWFKRPCQQGRLVNIIRGLYQATVRCGGDFIPVDGPPTEDQVAEVRAALPAWYRDLPAARLYDLARKVDPSKSAGDIHITYGAPIQAAPEAICEWEYGVGPAPPAEPELQISPATCRPFYKVGSATWREAATAQYRIDSRRMISMNELYGNYVVKYGAYPTGQQFLDYIYRRKIVNGTNKTLPRHMDAFVAGTLADYATIAATLPPAEFARRFIESRPIEHRCIMEKS